MAGNWLVVSCTPSHGEANVEMVRNFLIDQCANTKAGEWRRLLPRSLDRVNDLAKAHLSQETLRKFLARLTVAWMEVYLHQAAIYLRVATAQAPAAKEWTD